MDELCAYKQRTEKQIQYKDQQIEKESKEMAEIKDQLTEVKEKLTKSVEMEIQLRKNVNDLTSANEAEREKRNQVEMDLRVLVMKQSTDLIEFNCKHQRMNEQKDLTMIKLVNAAKEDKRTAAEYIDKLTRQINIIIEKKDKLISELNIRDKTQCLLHARVVELEDLLMVNMKNNTNKKSCLGTQVSSQDDENPMNSMRLERGDNYPQLNTQWSTNESQQCCSQYLIDNKQSCNLSQSTHDVTTTDDDIQLCFPSNTNIENDDQNISSEYSQTQLTKNWHMTELL